MSKFYNSPNPTQQDLDRAMARAMAIFPTRRNKTMLQKLAGLFNAIRRERRADNARRLARGNVDEQ